MEPAPQELLKRIEELAPQGSEVIPLGRAYEDEDHNIAVFIDEEEDARLAEKHLSDAVAATTRLMARLRGFPVFLEILDARPSQMPFQAEWLLFLLKHQ